MDINEDGEDDETEEAVDTNEESEDEDDEDDEDDETEEALYINEDGKDAETEEVVDIDEERKNEDGEDDETNMQWKNLLKISGFPGLRRGRRRGRSMLETFYVVLRWKILVYLESFFNLKRDTTVLKATIKVYVI